MTRCLSILVIFLLTQVLALPAVELACHVLGISSCPTALSAATAIIMAAAITAALLYRFRLVAPHAFNTAGCHLSTFGYTVLLMIPAIFLINLLTEALHLPDTNEALFQALASHPMGIIAITLAGPLAEELTFRTALQHQLSLRMPGSNLPIFLSALIFGVIHLNPIQIPGAILFGLVLAWLYQRFDTIWIPLAAHILNNAIAAISLTLQDSRTLVDCCGGLLPTLIIAPVMAVTGLLAFKKLEAMSKKGC